MNKEIIGFGIDVDFKDRSGAEIAKIIAYLEKLKVDWVRVNLDVKRAKDPKYLSTLKQAVSKLKENKINILGLITEFVPGNFTNIFFNNLTSPMLYFLFTMLLPVHSSMLYRLFS